MEKTKLREQIFCTLWEMMYQSGGDGDSLLICPDAELVADAFGEWLEMHQPNYMRRYDNLSFIGKYQGNQESISFKNLKDHDENGQKVPWVEYIVTTYSLI